MLGYEVESFLDGSFDLDFLEISLRQRETNSQEAISFSGPGFARQLSDGRILMKCFTQSSDPRATPFLIEQVNREWGKVAGDDSLFDIEAIDHAGRRWTCSPEIIFPDWVEKQSAGTLRVDIDRLKVHLDDKDPDDNRLQMIFRRQEIRQWAALREAPIKVTLHALCLDFTLSTDVQQDNEISLRVDAEQPLPPTLRYALIEALQFVMDQQIELSVIEVSDNRGRTTEFHAAAQMPIDVPKPPLRTIRRRNNIDVGRLLEAYLNFAFDPKRVDTAHPCTRYLSHSRRARSSSYEARSVALCVAVEGVAKLLKSPTAPENPEHREIQDFVRQWLKERSFASPLQERVNQRMKSLDELRVVDTMKHVAAAGWVRTEDVKTWTALRNSAVHTAGSAIIDLSRPRLQKQLDDFERVQNLLYGLVFHLIGYEGAFTNYGKHGYPQETYPVANRPSSS